MGQNSTQAHVGGRAGRREGIKEIAWLLYLIFYSIKQIVTSFVCFQNTTTAILDFGKQAYLLFLSMRVFLFRESCFFSLFKFKKKIRKISVNFN